ncbi:MAG: hypothetical protein COA78_19345 [Blastopirellula sp.]|nr:MAG: hypothetical protein COA78_19345 [Blastopirellula sp.]
MPENPYQSPLAEQAIVEKQNLRLETIYARTFMLLPFFVLASGLACLLMFLNRDTGGIIFGSAILLISLALTCLVSWIGIRAGRVLHQAGRRGRVGIFIHEVTLGFSATCVVIIPLGLVWLFVGV